MKYKLQTADQQT